DKLVTGVQTCALPICYTRGAHAEPSSDHEGKLSLKQAATRKGVPPHDLSRAIDAGELEAVEEGGEYFVAIEDLEDWVPHPKTAEIGRASCRERAQKAR